MHPLVQSASGPVVNVELQQRLARVSGLLYLVLAVLGMFSPVVLQTLVAPGDAATTASNLLGSRGLFGASLVIWILIVAADVAVSVTLYLLLEPASRALSLVAAAFRLVYAAVLGSVLLNLYDAYLLLTSPARAAALDGPQRQAMALSSIDTFSTGFLLALVFFGIHLVTLGFVLYRSRYVPRALGLLVVAAGVGYLVDSLASLLLANYGGPVRAGLLAPALVGELGLMAWLLVKGVNVDQQVATISSFTARPVATA